MAEERDIVDELIDDLNDGVESIQFERDVLETDRPEDWGAVEVTGQGNADWGDGNMTDQEITADVWVCLSGHGSKVKRDVQRVLKAFGGGHDIGWKLVNRAYLYDLNKVMWHWQVTLVGPLADDDEDPEEDPEWPEMDPDEGE